jgi:hypothetical protein
VKPRIRTIKPEAFTDEKLWDLEEETGLPIFRGFVGLWCVADKRGRFEWRPRALKTHILPYWDGDFSRVLDACATRGLVVKYACDGREYGWIPSFEKHQVVNNREQESEIPAPPETREVTGTFTREARVPDASPTPLVQVQAEGKGREGKGEDPRVDDATSLSPVASRVAGLSAVKASAHTDGQPLYDWIRDATVKAYENPVIKTPAPRETRDPTWVGWRELESWVVTKARLLQRDERDTARHLIRCFMRSKRARQQGYPVKFLRENAAEYWCDELPAEVA